MKIDRADFFLMLALMALVAFKFFGSPFFVPWWVGLAGANILVPIINSGEQKLATAASGRLRKFA